MPEADQRKQMTACFTHTMNRMQAHSEQLQQTVQEIMNSQQGQQMTQTQAINTLMFSWIMACYMNIDAGGVKQAVEGVAPTPELEQALFSQRPDRPQSVQQASKRQWQLLESVLKDHQ